MSKLFAGAIFLSLALLPASALAQRDREDRQDEGRHRGRDKHEDRDDDRDEGHDRGKHKGWYKHGRYEHVRERFVVRTFEVRTRRVYFPDRSVWVIADYDMPRCRDWSWDRDEVYVYDDDVHPGWYVLFNARVGRYVHVQYFGVG